MNKPLIAIIAFYVSSLVFSGQSFGQLLQTDSVQFKTVSIAIRNFYKSIGTQSKIYKGYSYQAYNPSTKGSAYFLDSLNFINGSVVYEGNLYHDVPLLYDMYKDVVISSYPDQTARFTLFAKYVQAFDLAGHHFIRLMNDTSNLKAGFYDELYSNKLRVLVKRQRSLQAVSSGLAINSYFDNSTIYYLKKGSVYYNVGSEPALLKVLSERKRELKLYLKSNNIKFKSTPEKAIVMLADYYDRLTN